MMYKFNVKEVCEMRYCSYKGDTVSHFFWEYLRRKLIYDEPFVVVALPYVKLTTE